MSKLIRPLAAHQTGIAMLTVLVLIVLVIFAVSGALTMVRSNTLQVAATQSELYSFQVAESGLAGVENQVESLKSTREYDANAYTVKTICAKAGGCTTDADNRFEAELQVQVWYAAEGELAPLGYSLDRFAGHHISTRSKSSYRGFAAEVEAGYVRVGPRSP